MAQSSQKTGYVLIQDGAVLTEDGTEYILIQDGAVFTLDGVRPFPRRPLMQMSPLERERVITKMAYDLTGDGCDPVGKWLLRLPVQTPDQIKEGAFQVWLRTSNLGSASPRASRCPASLPGRYFGSSGPCAHCFGAGLSGQSPPHQQGISAVLKMAAAILDHSRLCSVQNIGLKSRSLGLKALPQRCRWTLCIFGPTASWFVGPKQVKISRDGERRTGASQRGCYRHRPFI
ncbi:hypothetical protein NDU88_006899 [Pleurodeles waltl]|uniref:Uncharacterized protein n=1 Tax=Pleurodeles waltl TaxID=8319 RepID=A0AAV7WFT7_PLEWA|nr:hypothetical protein NDU88_006899 [Pleurodeles waltl]